MLVEAFLSKGIDILYDFIVKTIKETPFTLKSTKEDVLTSLEVHVQSTKNWADEIIFSELKKAKSTNDVYVDLDLYIYPRRIRISLDESIPKMPIDTVVSKENSHILLLGQPGSGKTTSMKYLCNRLFYNESFLENFQFPIVIKLREYNQLHHRNKNDQFKQSLIFDSLFNLLGLNIEWSGKSNTDGNQEQIEAIKERIILKLVDSLGILLILDGFDEIAFTNRREIVINEISKLAHFLERSKIIVTSRNADFNYSIEKLVPFEICPLNDNQIFTFANKWLGTDEDANRFVNAVNDSPFADTAIRPLTIAHLCAIYERVGKIPEKPKTVYKKIVNLLLEEWDGQRDVKRVSKYANFELDRKFDFLSCLAHQLTISLQSTIFSKKQLENVYNKIFQDFDLMKNESKEVVIELESHTGLFVQSGYDYYEFAHKSLQEYLAAEYIVKLPKLPDIKQIYRYPNEIAIATTISSNSSLYFIELVNKIPDQGVDLEFIEIFINRLLLEKPDFNQNQDIIIAALRLYSLYLSYNFQDKQLRLFVSDPLLTQFERFIETVFKKNSYDILVKYYTENGHLVSDHGFEIIVFQRQTKLTSLPKTLYCRETFIKDTSSL
ncbi:NACHT domain-containing protein [uncultured Dysgonomonas sp.]|uniref:NACHT domain-containing protein n=1 Tax=uncultured Dysgonomonas sp. TaxID=206096 RepID=UPI00280525B3|nr:NACHT domain-containing protein [uncultured Dysgonomonas sp.]